MCILLMVAVVLKFNESVGVGVLHTFEDKFPEFRKLCKKKSGIARMIH